MKAALVEAVRSIVNLIADGEWSVVERLTTPSLVDSTDLQQAVRSYGRTLVHAPAGIESFIDAVKSDAVYQISVPLWSLEEGRSDLELRLTARPVTERIWALTLDDVLVP